MRTAVSNAVSLRRLRWQAAFAKTYRTSSPVLWQHVFVSDTPMTNWSGGSSLFLNWAAEKTPEGRVSRQQISGLKTIAREAREPVFSSEGAPQKEAPWRGPREASGGSESVSLRSEPANKAPHKRGNSEVRNEVVRGRANARHEESMLKQRAASLAKADRN